MRKDRSPALRYGLVASLILHLAVLALNPGLTTPPSARATSLRQLPVPEMAAVALEAPADASRAAPRRSTPAAASQWVPTADAPERSRADSVSPAALAAAAERLRATRDPLLFSRPTAPLPPPSREDQALQRLAARLKEAGKQGAAEAPRPGMIRIPFLTTNPPPPAQVVPPPARLASIASDSVRRRGDLVYGYFGGYSLALPAVLESGQAFEVAARFPGPVERGHVLFFVDGDVRADARSVLGVVRVSLRIDTPGEHRIRIQFLQAGEFGPAEIIHVVRVDTAPGRP